MVVARVCRALVFLGVAYPQAHALHAPAHSAGAACHAALLQSMGDARRSSSGLVLPKLLGYRKVDFKVDSMLVVNQMKGIYKIKNRELWPINERIRMLMTKFERVTFTHVNRQFNQLADGMVNKTLDAHKAHPGERTVIEVEKTA